MVNLSMYKKYADHLKVTWYIMMLTKLLVYKNPKGGGEGLDFQPMVYRAEGVALTASRISVNQ